jgi:hypothetical protein
MKNGKDRRNILRVEVNWPVVLYDNDDEISGESKNISIEGLSICCDKPLQLNRLYRLSIKPPNHQSIGVTGKVIWSDLYGMEESKAFGVGVCLVELSEEDRNSLEDLISNCKQQNKSKED